MDIVRQNNPSSLVIKLQKDVFTKVLQRNFRAQTSTEAPYLVRPILELSIVSDAPFERDRCEFNEPRGFASRAGIAAFPVVNHFGCAPQPASLAHSRNVAAIPFHTELKILIGIKSLWVEGEFSHDAIGVIQNDVRAVNLSGVDT